MATRRSHDALLAICWLGVGVLIGSCGVDSTRAEGQSAATDAVPAPAPTDVGGAAGPGFAATLTEGCEPASFESFEVYEPASWEHINTVTWSSGLLLEGRVEQISEPRITNTPDVDPPAGGPEDTYFRLLMVEVLPGSLRISQEPPRNGELVSVLLFGAGNDVSEDQLCFGPDPDAFSEEPRIEPGSRVLLLGTLREDFPIRGLEGEVLFLQRGLSGLWVVDDDGSTRSALPEFEVDSDYLRTRISEEIGRGKIPFANLPATDSLSTPPVYDE